jgi:uncharacterized protein (TIGR03643 family)
MFFKAVCLLKAIIQMVKKPNLQESAVSEIIAMALSDHTSFAAIQSVYELSPDQVKTLMRTSLKPGSYRAWRKRISTFGARREHYK